MKLFFLPVLCIFSPVFLSHCVGANSSVDSRCLPELFLFVDGCVILDFHEGHGGWGLLYRHLGDIPSLIWELFLYLLYLHIDSFI